MVCYSVGIYTILSGRCAMNYYEDLEMMCEETIKANLANNNSKYVRTIKGVSVDVYDVLKAFNVRCPAMQHALKKMLCSGLRGHKDMFQDKEEAIQSIKRSIELDKE